ncbi:hypothetical protein BZA05DRAFT_382474 [Tricharina praecox]|uniref:uncharacterized protein n=1 Tax=Tricharina praecox TaxID=43433 RepID=UPI00221F9BA9|nr:uncharacterized protein BZA05DRAFT_382474 [Tricharina praecox]KAI5858798.1 hypothetical protein BZA05DRAFT_382474 [Tricharina praecox]
MAEAESRQASTAMVLEELESQNAQLEVENEKTLEENKRLLRDLEELNSSMAMSELRVRELQEDLDAAHAELSRISAHAARTAVLEAQLAVLESEQEELRNTITTTKEEERAAVARWKRAERQLAELENQLERIQREHTLERARSKNILERMEQRKLASQRAGTFPTTLAADKNAISRFMKEILAENGHLQLGVAELRDMLAQSQEEIKMLREKLEVMGSDHHIQVDSGRSPLSMELARSPSPQSSTTAAGVVVHHHHYHALPGNKGKAIKPPLRRPKKKKNISGDHHIDTLRVQGFDAASGSSSRAPKRWSTSTGALSSSPTSTFRDSSIFDRMDNGDDTSRPTSADSNYAPWPKQSWGKHTRKVSHPPPFTILNTTQEVSSDPESISRSPPQPSPMRAASPPIPILKRSVSHESLLSISALDHSAYHTSPALSVSSFTSRRPDLRSHRSRVNDPQASITHGVAIRDSPGSSQWGGSAYSRLLGLAEGSPPTGKTLSRKPSAASSNGAGGGSGWFWKYVTLAPGGSKPGRSEEPKAKKPITRPIAGFVDEDLLRESLVDGPGLS